MRPVRVLALLRGGLAIDAAGAVVADVVDIDDGVVDDYVAIDVDAIVVGMPAAIEVDDGAVVEEVVPAPLATIEADAAVAEAVVDATVVADLGTPVALVPAVVTAFIAPVAGGPEIAGLRSEDPGAGNPEVAGVAVGPVAGRPDVAVAGDGGLDVDGQRRWGNADVEADADADLCLCGGQREEGYGDSSCDEQAAKVVAELHGRSPCSNAA